MHASNWGRYLNRVKLHHHRRQHLADFAFGNEVGERKKGVGYLSPAHRCEQGPSPASWVCLTWGSQIERGVGSSPVPRVPERAATLPKLSTPKARVLNVVIFSFCTNSGKPCTFLHVSVFLFECVIFQ